MKKTTTTYSLLLVAFLLSCPTLFGQQISLEEAQLVAKNVLKTNAITSSTSSLKGANIANYYTKEENGQVVYYAFNFEPTGFVVIAADDRYNPVLAFSNESHLDLENQVTNIGLVGTLSTHAQRMTYIREHNLPAPRSILKEWQQLRSGEPVSTSRSSNIVGPLTTTKWNQGEFYNGQCPADETTADTGPAGRTYCGCIPIAMGQLIKYHNFPVQGNGEHSYVDENFGLQSADFCSTFYNWDNMPDELTEDNEDIAQLLSQMGIASNTQYSISYTETYFSYVRDAYVNYFGYDNSARWFYDSDYTGFAQVAKQDLDRGLPLLLTGTSETLVGHTWVADGYGSFGNNETADYFHFNWGWGGSNNGWFLDSGESWDPLDGQGEGVQQIIYYWDRYVLHNLFPADSPCQSPPSSDVFPQGIQDNYTYFQLQNLLLDQEINFRYRKANTTEWTVTDITTEHFKLVRDLTPGTQYEFQGRRKCCSGDWSDYTTLQTFTTTGTAPTSPEPTNSCLPLASNQLTSGSISENFAYVYTAQPYGQVSKRFRFREAGTTNWTRLDATTNHYQALSNLQAGTSYEFQVTHRCGEGEWSGYSEIQTFNTSGLVTCAAVFFADLDGDGFGDENNFISGCSAPDGYVNNTDDCDDANPNIPATPGSACEGGIIGSDGCSCNASSSSQSSCPTVTGSLTSSSISDNNAYVYTPQPLGAVNNQFRYRPVGGTTWRFSGIATYYYRYLSDLSAGTQYEFQVSQQCSDGNYSDFSASSYFTTTGTDATGGDTGGNEDSVNNNDSENSDSNLDNNPEASSDCASVTSSQLYVSNLSAAAGYVYTPQPYGATNNQFRYRAVGSSNWTTTDRSALYYRYITALAAVTQYEYQVRHECDAGIWSAYSDSYIFTTATSSQLQEVALPMAYATLRDLSAQQNTIDLQIAPNPVFNELLLKLNKPFAKAATARIYSVDGQLIKELSLQEADRQISIEVGNLTKGIYLLEYQTSTAKKTVKFIKE